MRAPGEIMESVTPTAGVSERVVSTDATGWACAPINTSMSTQGKLTRGGHGPPPLYRLAYLLNRNEPRGPVNVRFGPGRPMASIGAVVRTDSPARRRAAFQQGA